MAETGFSKFSGIKLRLSLDLSRTILERPAHFLSYEHSRLIMNCLSASDAKLVAYKFLEAKARGLTIYYTETFWISTL